jgi:hypothetical protein
MYEVATGWGRREENLPEGVDKGREVVRTVADPTRLCKRQPRPSAECGHLDGRTGGVAIVLQLFRGMGSGGKVRH